MPNEKYDVLVIGSGPAGYVAAIRAAQLGFNTACVEKDSTLGGTCLNVGCIPSKTLLQSTEYYSLMKHQGAELGLEFDGLRYQFQRMMERKTEVVKGLTEGIDHLFEKNKVRRIRGIASFIDAHTVEVTRGDSKERVESKYIIIATGSEPFPLPFLPFDEKKVVSSTGALSLSKVPKSMVVIGAGVIGVELASVYQRLGCDVTLVEMLDRICPTNDLAISKAFLQILKKQGLKFYLSAKVTGGKVHENGVVLNFTHEGAEMSFDVEAVLVAVGRRPYIEGLALDKASVKLSPKGFIEVDGRFRTSQKNILAIGDVIEGPMLAHKASEEAIVAVDLLAGLKSHISYTAIPNVIYTHPEVAAVGLTESEAKEHGLTPEVGITYFRGNPRARCSGDTEGLVKIIGDKSSGRLVGLHIIGPHASELIAEGVMALEKKATLEDIANASHAHPTLSEAIKEAALTALKRPIHG